MAQINPDFGEDDAQRQKMSNDIAGMVKHFKASPLKSEVEKRISETNASGNGLDLSGPRYGANFLNQIGLLSHRGFVNSYRNPGLSLL